MTTTYGSSEEFVGGFGCIATSRTSAQARQRGSPNSLWTWDRPNRHVKSDFHISKALKLVKTCRKSTNSLICPKSTHRFFRRGQLTDNQPNSQRLCTREAWQRGRVVLCQFDPCAEEWRVAAWQREPAFSARRTGTVRRTQQIPSRNTNMHYTHIPQMSCLALACNLRHTLQDKRDLTRFMPK